MENQLLKAALWYLKNGMNVIPVRHDKKPFIEWAKYQTERVTESQVKEWWRQFPKANIGVITGEISNMMSVDCDSQAGIDAVNEYLPENFATSTSQTPSGGQHSHFKFHPGLVNRARVLTDTDIRTSGGYIIVPPSKNGRGSYSWLPGLKISEVPPAEMPETLFAALQACPSYNIDNMHLKGGYRGGENQPDFNRLQVTSSDFKEGRRDEALFSLAHHLLKGGMPEENVRNYLYFFSKNCEPPFPETEAETKIQSALKRNERAEISIAEEVRDFIVTSSGFFLTSECFNRLQVTSRQEKKAVTLELLRLHKKGIIERHGNKNGCYRRIEHDCDSMDFMQAETESLDLWLPFNIHQLVEIMPGNIILLAGSPNAGKTGLLLNIIRSNQAKFDVHYFNSEMGSGELKKRLMLFDDMSIDMWRFKAWERSLNFSDVIKPGPGKLNIIDYLEIHDNFYEIGGKLASIHDKLKGAVAIVALQKNKGCDTGLGGFRSLEKPRLYLSMESGTLKIIKAKNWRGSENPNGKQICFKVVNGCKFIQTKGWHHPSK